MDEKTRLLIEEAEDHAAKDDNYDVAEHARDDVPALCETIRELDAQNNRLVESFLDLVIEKMGVDWFRAYMEKRRANKP